MKNIRRIQKIFHSFLSQVNFILTLCFGEVRQNQTLSARAVLPVSDADLLKRAAYLFEVKKQGGAR
jgi:hypothetical protein